MQIIFILKLVFLNKRKERKKEKRQPQGNHALKHLICENVSKIDDISMETIWFFFFFLQNVYDK